MTMFFFSFLISTLYSKAKVAAACAGIIYFLTYVPYMYVAIKEDVAGDDISNIVKTLVVSGGIMVLTLIKLLLYSHQ